MSGIIRPYSELREPTEKEREQLFTHYENVVGYNAEQAYDVAFSSAIAVFTSYRTDSPGYTGKVMIVVGGAEYIYELFIWNKDGKLEHVRKDSQI